MSTEELLSANLPGCDEWTVVLGHHFFKLEISTIYWADKQRAGGGVATLPSAAAVTELGEAVMKPLAHQNSSLQDIRV